MHLKFFTKLSPLPEIPGTTAEYTLKPGTAVSTLKTRKTPDGAAYSLVQYPPREQVATGEEAAFAWVPQSNLTYWGDDAE